jgi:hypothetical protein
MTFACQFAVAGLAPGLPNDGRSRPECVRVRYSTRFRSNFRFPQPLNPTKSPVNTGVVATDGPLEPHQPGEHARTIPIPGMHW